MTKKLRPQQEINNERPKHRPVVTQSKLSFKQDEIDTLLDTEIETTNQNKTKAIQETVSLLTTTETINKNGSTHQPHSESEQSIGDTVLTETLVGENKTTPNVTDIPGVVIEDPIDPNDIDALFGK